MHLLEKNLRVQRKNIWFLYILYHTEIPYYSLNFPYAKAFLVFSCWYQRKSGRSGGRCGNWNGEFHDRMTRRCGRPGKSRTSTKCSEKFWIFFSWMSPYYSEPRSSRPQKKMTDLWSSDRSRNPWERIWLRWKDHSCVSLSLRTRTRWDGAIHPVSSSSDDTRAWTRIPIYIPPGIECARGIRHTRYRCHSRKKSQRSGRYAHECETARKKC